MGELKPVQRIERYVYEVPVGRPRYRVEVSAADHRRIQRESSDVDWEAIMMEKATGRSFRRSTPSDTEADDVR